MQLSGKEKGATKPSKIRVAVVGDRCSFALQLTDSLHNTKGLECLFYGPRTDPAGDVKRTVVFSGFRDYRPVWTTYRYPLEILSELARDPPHVVHFDFTITTFGETYASSVGVAFLVPLLRLLGYKVVLTVHDVITKEVLSQFMESAPLKTALLWPLMKVFYRLISCANALIVHFETQRVALENSFAIPTTKIVTMPFGVGERPVLATTEVSRWREVIKDRRTVLFFGVISPRKGIEYLVEAFSSLPKEYSDVLLILAGPSAAKDQSYLDSILEKTEKLRASGRFMLLGYLEEPDAHAVLELSDVVVLPYLYSYASPSILYWAVQHQKAVIASKVATLKEELAGYVDELLVDPRNSQQIESALESVLSDKQLREMAERFMASKAAANNWVNVGECLRELYGRLFEH